MYSGLSQSSKAYNPIVFELGTQTNAESKRTAGSRRKTFMTTPIVLNVAKREKTGAAEGRPAESSGVFGNSSFMRMNSMRRSSNLSS